MIALHKLSEPLAKLGVLFDWQQRWFSGNYRDMHAQFARYTAHGQHVLDLGCGAGGCAHRIWEGANSRYVGADLSRSYLQMNRARHPDASVVLADLGKLPFRWLDFDAICLFSILHHLDDSTLGALGSFLAKHVAAKTRILIAEPVFPPSKSCASDRVSHFLLSHDRGRHIRPSRDYVRLLGEGLETVRAFEFKYSLHHFCGFELRRRGDGSSGGKL
ncbi:MAG: class I SAM-dependent methyltransferase [Verrucomicrobiia bacterium]